MKYLILILFVIAFSCSVFAQDAPYANTPNYGLGLWLDGDEPGAAALNADKTTIDSAMHRIDVLSNQNKRNTDSSKANIRSEYRAADAQYVKDFNPNHFELINDTLNIKQGVLDTLAKNIDLSNYVTLNGTEEITGQKDFSGTPQFSNGFVLPYNNPGYAGVPFFSQAKSTIGLGLVFGGTSYMATETWSTYTLPTLFQYQTILPVSTATYNLGSGTKYWENAYINNINGSGTFTLTSNIIYLNGKLQYKSESIAPAGGGTLTITSDVEYLTPSVNVEYTAIQNVRNVTQKVTFVNLSDTYTITFTEGTYLKINGSNMVLGQDDTITFLYCPSTSKWIEISRSDN